MINSDIHNVLGSIKEKELYEPELNKITNMDYVPYLIKKEIPMTQNFFISLAVKVLTPFLSLITAPIKNELETFIKNLYVKAKATESPIDDMFVKLLGDILGITLE